MSLRPYQVAALEAARIRYREGQRCVLLQLATGTGKTVIFAEAAKLCRGNVLMVNERQELVDQTAARVGEWCGEPVGIEMGDRRALSIRASSGPRIVAASVQSLARRLSKIDGNWPRLVIIDEAHHSTARTYRSIIDHFADARVLGLTATPDRSDQEFLGQVFESLAFEYSIRDGIRDGWLVPVKTIAIRTTADFSAIRTTAGDLNTGDLDAIMRRESMLAEVAGPLVERAGMRPSIAFSVTVEHAHDLARAINAVAGTPSYAAAIDGSASRDERAEFLARARRGDVKCIVNCALFTEGFDHPPIEVVAMARPTKSRALYTQMVGRGTRPSIDTGKSACLVIDFTANSKRHRLVRAYDIFDGEISEDGLEIIDQIIEESDGEIDVQAALDLSDERIRAAAAAKRYSAVEIDTLASHLLGKSIAAGGPPTQEQCARLLNFGTHPAVLSNITETAAKTLIASLELREERGLATPPQIRLLNRFGINATNMSKESATRVIAEARRSGFRPSAVRMAARQEGVG